MDQKQALETLIALDDRRAYCVNVEEWYDVYIVGDPAKSTLARITIFTPSPSISAGVAKLISGAKLPLVLEQAIQYIKTANAATPC